MAPSHLSDRPLVICEVLISSPQECTTFRRRMGLYACCALRSCLPHEDQGFESRTPYIGQAFMPMTWEHPPLFDQDVRESL
jgi:hypothetical protein